ncbi:MAG: hypothetical protein Kow0042_03260 [Calditrichia bacterium]
MPDVEDKFLDEKESVDESNEPEVPESSGEKKFSFMTIGVPVLLVQIVIAYFLANNFIVPRLYGDSASVNAAESSAEIHQSEALPEFGKIFTIEDIIVNPAESRGMQFVLINLGFEVKKESDLKLLEERKIQVRDLLIKVVSQRTLSQLDGPEDKEQLRLAIKEEMEKLLPPNHLMNVYFSNYIIQ